MKLTWAGLITGIFFYTLAFVPSVLPHNGDMMYMLLSGLLIASFSFIGFDLPLPRKKLSVWMLIAGSLVFLGGVLMALIGHPLILFIISVPALGLVLIGLRQLFLTPGDVSSLFEE